MISELWLTFKEMVEEVCSRVVAEIDNIVLLLKIMIPVILSLLDLPLSATVALSAVFVFLISYVNRVEMNVNNELRDGMPVPPVRFTRVEDDVITIEEREGAIEYLCLLEDYLERKSVM